MATRRENLHQLLFAEGACVKKTESGDPYFTALSQNGGGAISDDRLFLGGDVDYRTPATKAEVLEHSFVALATDETTTLFEGEIAAGDLTTPGGVEASGAIAIFDGPMHDLAISGGTIIEQGVNYAVLGASGYCTLTGKKYTHTTRMISKAPIEENVVSNRSLVEIKDNVVSVKDATLVTLPNSENVSDRVIAYYGLSRDINTDILVGTERPGDTVDMEDPSERPQQRFTIAGY